jgi:VanZ family protein
MLRKNIFSILVALVILYLSLANSSTFDEVPIEIPNFDKLVHVLMYFGLMSVIMIENRKSLITARRIFLISLVPLIYGILMEVLQGSVTSTRTASVFDALADAAGILLAILAGSIVLKKLRSDAD